MSREDILDEINYILSLCQDNKCGIVCSHSDKLKELGALLEEETRVSREARKDMQIMFEPEKELEFDLDFILEMIADGKTNADIEKHYGVTNSKLSYFLQKHGIRNKNSSQYSDDKINENLVLELIEQGLTNKEIAAKIGRTKNSLTGFMKRKQIKNPNWGKAGKRE